MFYKKIFPFLFIIFISNCASINQTKIQSTQFLDDPFINKGFALIYNENLLKEKIISRKIDERSLIIFQKNLKKNTKVKITNIKNNRSIIVTVGNNANYPCFNNSVLSIRIADEINLDKKEPYVEILEILENSVFVAKRAKTFEEEKEVVTKAPVNDISISDLNNTEIESLTKTTNKFLYKIKIAPTEPFKTKIKINDLSYLLGYTEPSSFVRSFRNWTGMTPKMYREKSSL